MLQLKNSDYKLKDVDPDGAVLFVANAFGVEDSQGDISLRGSFTKTLKESFSRLKYLYNHDREKVIGVPIEGYENETGLIVKAVLNLDKTLGKDTYLDYKHAMEYGRSVEHSVAVKAVKSQGNNPRYVSEWMLAEVSYTPLRGANQNTPLLDIKSDEFKLEDKSFIEYCYNNGDYSCGRMKFYEALLGAGNTHSSSAADEQLNKFLNLLNF